MANSIPTGGIRYSDLPETYNIEETDEMFMLRENAGSRINMDTFTNAIASKTTGVEGLIGDAFDSEQEYENGDYCIYNNALYKFIGHKDSGEWDPDVAEVVKVANEIRDIYPVGSIYMSVNSTDPATLFGGTWEQIEDCFLLAAGSGYAAGSTGGAATVTLTTAQMPSHTHTGPSHTHSLPSHTHSLPSHTHSTPSHTHSIPALSGTAASAGSHTHSVNYDNLNVSTGSTYTPNINSSGASTSSGPVNSAGAHTHTVTTTSSTTGSSSGTSGSTSGTSGETSGTSGSSGTGATGSTGSGNSHENMPPYLAVYVWQRVA